MHRLRVAGRLLGVVLAVGCVLVFLASEPAMRGLVGGAIALGALIATALYFLHRSASPNPDTNYKVEQEYPHPGFTINRIRFGGGFAGLVFTVGCMALFLAGLPVLWYPFIAALALGAGIATFLYLRHH